MKFFPFYTYPQQLAQTINKSLVGFIPAALTQQIISLLGSGLDAENWSHATFAVLTVFYNRLGEAIAKKGYAEEDFKALHLASKASCTQKSAEQFIQSEVKSISCDEKKKIESILLEAGVSSEAVKQQLEGDKLSCISQLLATAIDYDIFKMLVTGMVCFYMPIPTSNPLYAKIFNSAITSASSFTISLLTKNINLSLFSRCFSKQNITHVQNSENYQTLSINLQ